MAILVTRYDQRVQLLGSRAGRKRCRGGVEPEKAKLKVIGGGEGSKIKRGVKGGPVAKTHLELHGKKT